MYKKSVKFYIGSIILKIKQDFLDIVLEIWRYRGRTTREILVRVCQGKLCIVRKCRETRQTIHKAKLLINKKRERDRKTIANQTITFILTKYIQKNELTKKIK